MRAGAVHVQDSRERLAGVGFFGARYVFGSSLCDDAASALAAFRAEIEDPVGLFYYVEIVLDDQNGVAEIGKAQSLLTTGCPSTSRLSIK